MAEAIMREFEVEKETRNTVRFVEDARDQAPVVGSLYIQKFAVARLGGPKRLRVTIEPIAPA